MALPKTFDGDIQSIKAIGHGALALIDAAIILAIVAVVLSTRAQTANVISSLFGFLSWLVGQVITPLQQVAPINLTSTWTPAGSVGSGGAGTAEAIGAVGGDFSLLGSTTGTTATGGTVGDSTAALPAGWSATYVPGYTFGSTTINGQAVFGYYPPGTVDSTTTGTFGS